MTHSGPNMVNSGDGRSSSVTESSLYTNRTPPNQAPPRRFSSPPRLTANGYAAAPSTNRISVFVDGCPIDGDVAPVPSTSRDKEAATVPTNQNLASAVEAILVMDIGRASANRVTAQPDIRTVGSGNIVRSSYPATKPVFHNGTSFELDCNGNQQVRIGFNNEPLVNRHRQNANNHQHHKQSNRPSVSFGPKANVLKLTDLETHRMIEYQNSVKTRLKCQEIRRQNLKISLEISLLALYQIKADVKSVTEKLSAESTINPESDNNQLEEEKIRLQSEIDQYFNEIGLLSTSCVNHSDSLNSPNFETDSNVAPVINERGPDVISTQISNTAAENDEEQWKCEACTFLNHNALKQCELCDLRRSAICASATTVTTCRSKIGDWIIVDESDCE